MQRCSKKAYARCPYRHLCGPIEEACFTDDSDCAKFNRLVEDKTMTNSDRIRAMSDEELAKCLFEIGFDCHLCSEHERLSDNPLLKHEKCDEKCTEHCLEWLQQPAEDV